MNYKTLADIGDITGKKVLVRLDFNVPIDNGAVRDDYRIQKSLQTINFLREHQAKIIIISHIEGREHSLKPVFEYLKNTLSLPVEFCEDCLENGQANIEKLNNGEVLLCENLRLYDGEKKNDEEFAKKLSALGEIFVNDAFSVSHRAHASVVGVPKFLPTYIGFQFDSEVKHLSECFNPPHPFLFILGGAKFDTKLPLVEKFLDIADTIFVGGALGNDLFKARGLNVGASLISDSSADFSKYLSNPKIIMPTDVAVGQNIIKKPEEVQNTEAIYDAGPETLALLTEEIKKAKHILWNGPLGNYENGYKQPTLDLAKAIAESGAKSFVGGGDTLAAISELKLEDKFTFISTGGGAMLDFLAKGTLPGLEVLKK
jgi:phosphoglycerate kinase